jgi:phage terminase large subunit-like protein
VTALLDTGQSPAQRFAKLPKDERDEQLVGLSDAERLALWRSWHWWARPSQLAPPGAWRWWVNRGGRGSGKTRTGSEEVVDRAEAFAAADHDHLIGLGNSTYSEVRAIQIGGPSGLRAVCERRGHRLDIGATSLEGTLAVQRDDGRWHESRIEIHTADQPDRSRGRNFATVWLDEVSKWKQKIDSEGGTAFSNIDLGLRALCPPGLRPRGIVTMTPKAIPLVRDLLAGRHGDTVITGESMFANRANLDPSFIAAVLRRYLGTRLGAQEIEGILLDTVEGALWQGERIELTRIKLPGALTPDEVLAALEAAGISLIQIVVGVDPPGGLRTECGIVVAGWAWQPDPLRIEAVVPHLFVLDDQSMAGGSDEWAPKVIQTAAAWHADRVVAEVNYGGDMVRDVIQVREPTLTVEKVHASRGKAIRAEPVSALWDQQRGHMVGGGFGELEGELTTWVPGDPLSPNRLDAMVWCGHAMLPDLASVDMTHAYGQLVADARL